MFGPAMPGLSLHCPDALLRALDERAALRGLSPEAAAVEILARSLDVRETRPSILPTPSVSPPAPGDDLDDEALQLAIRETSAFLEGG